jgi:hypothetical protein
VAVPKGPSLAEAEIRSGRAAADRLGFEVLGIDEMRVESLSPRVVLLRRVTPPS